MDQELCEFMNFGVRSSSVPEHIHVSGKLGHVLPRHNLPCVGGTVTQFAFRSGTKPSREAPAQFASLPKDDSGITDAHGGSYHLIECCPQGGKDEGTCRNLWQTAHEFKDRLVNQRTLDIEEPHF